MDSSPSSASVSTQSSLSPPSAPSTSSEATRLPTSNPASRERLHYETTRSDQSDSLQRETWLDFLRAGEHNSGRPPPPLPPPPSGEPPGYLDPPFVLRPRGALKTPSQAMADRKRRFTQPESPGRRNGPAQSESGPSGQQAGPSAVVAPPPPPGSSVTNAIDLTSLARTPPREPPSVPAPDRRSSELVLPRWQPDSEATHCPVCQSQFTFFYRKHHCRKCGRVVCSNCSPHRITIPRQFIVRPPDPPSAIIDLTGSDNEGSPISPHNVWGGEEVRVCNPCVPDPNLSPPPQQHSALGSQAHWRYSENNHQPPPPRHRNSTGPLPPPPSHHGHRSTLSDAALLAARSQRGQDPFRHANQFINPSSVRDLWPPTAPPGQQTIYPPRLSSANGSSSAPRPSPFPYRSMLDINAPVPPAPPPPHPRRQIAEEDECPICGTELPPKGPNGETTVREGHVKDCIQSHLYTGTPPRVTSAPPDIGEGSVSASTSAPSASSTSLPPNSLSSASASGRLRQRRMTGGRMLVYHATEKDCLGEDEEPQECVICFEEFDEGDEMGRLECLCKFHRSCIRQWWDTKGVGSCPTHQLHD